MYLVEMFSLEKNPKKRYQLPQWVIYLRRAWHHYHKSAGHQNVQFRSRMYSNDWRGNLVLNNPVRNFIIFSDSMSALLWNPNINVSTNPYVYKIRNKIKEFYNINRNKNQINVYRIPASWTNFPKLPEKRYVRPTWKSLTTGIATNTVDTKYRYTTGTDKRRRVLQAFSQQ